MDLTDYLDALGLGPENALGELSREFRYRPPKEARTELDRHGIPRTRWRDVRTTNDWEALQAALWSTSIRAVAEMSETSFSRVARALDQKSPFAVRKFW